MPQSAEMTLSQILDVLGGALGGVRLGAPVSGSIPVSGSVTVTGSPTTTPRGTGLKASATFTRPANATPYTAGDVVGATAAALTFAWTDADGNAAPAGADILITTIALEVDVVAVPAGMTTFSLWLYNVTPPSALADNAPHDIPAGDRAALEGMIEGLGPVDMGSTLYDELKGVNKQIRLAAGSSSSYGYLETDGAYTPTSESVKKITMHAVVL